MSKQKVLCVGDLHGRHELAALAVDTFERENYDKLIFHGDYADGECSDEDILKTFSIVMYARAKYKEKVIPLIGNHDEPYFHSNPKEYICPGYRPSVHRALHPIISPKYKDFFYAYGIKNFLFTHAGVSQSWFLKHFDILELWAGRMDLDITEVSDIHEVIDNIKFTSDKYILHEIGPDRGGFAADFGGPLWCDKTEMMEQGPLIGLNQVVGHTAQHYITRHHVFEGDKRYENTSVAFIDCLAYRHQFLTLEI